MRLGLPDKTSGSQGTTVAATLAPSTELVRFSGHKPETPVREGDRAGWWAAALCVPSTEGLLRHLHTGVL